jgi:hypothetical protein
MPMRATIEGGRRELCPVVATDDRQQRADALTGISRKARDTGCAE